MTSLAFLSDFGLQDVYVGVMRAVALGIAPSVPQFDLGHDLPPQDVAAASFALAAAVPYLPPACVVCVVVDPGVGTARRAVALRARHGGRTLTFVAPDNGVLQGAWTRVDAVDGVVEVRDPRYRLPDAGTTFDGRDVFAPAAAHLAHGVPLEALGPALSLEELVPAPWPEPERTSSGWRAPVVLADHFGTLVTTLPAAEARARPWRVRLRHGGRSVDVGPVRRTFADVAVGAFVAYTGSSGTLEVAVRNGDAAAALGVARAAARRDVMVELDVGQPPDGAP